MTEDELFYLRAQFKLLEPQNGFVTIDNFKEVSLLPFFLLRNLFATFTVDAYILNFVQALVRNATDAMRESNILDILKMVRSLLLLRLQVENY